MTLNPPQPPDEELPAQLLEAYRASGKPMVERSFTLAPRCPDVRLVSGTRCIITPAGHTEPHEDERGARWISWSAQDGATGDVAGFLYLLRGNPTLLDEAPGSDSPDAIERRVEEWHTCIRCGALAAVALVAHIPGGSRWLDLCAGCGRWLEAGINEMRRTEEYEQLRKGLT